MPKMKTNRGAKKRFKVSGSGKIIRRKSSAKHLLSKKSNKRKRHLAHPTTVSPADERRIERLLGIG